MSAVLRQKGGDILCDIGKYLVTAVPLTYILSEKFESYLIAIFPILRLHCCSLENLYAKTLLNF